MLTTPALLITTKRTPACANSRGLVPLLAVARARSAIWYPAKTNSWQNGAVWYLFAAGSEVWYPPSGESRGLVPAKAARAFRDQAFLRAAGTKSPRLAETGVPNLEFCQNRSRRGPGVPNFGFCHARRSRLPCLTARRADPLTHGQRRNSLTFPCLASGYRAVGGDVEAAAIDALVLEQPQLVVDAPGIPRQASLGAHHTMAGNDAYRVAPHRRSDGGKQPLVIAAMGPVLSRLEKYATLWGSARGIKCDILAS